MHKWCSHARRTLLREVALYTLLMMLFVLDLSIIGTATNGGRKGFLSFVVRDHPDDGPLVTANGWSDTSANGLASTVCEAAIAGIALRGIACVSALLAAGIRG